VWGISLVQHYPVDVSGVMMMDDRAHNADFPAVSRIVAVLHTCVVCTS
jgi:hypothetical protein